jgi:hypothetical protein
MISPARTQAFRWPLPEQRLNLGAAAAQARPGDSIYWGVLCSAWEVRDRPAVRQVRLHRIQGGLTGV